MIFLMDSMIDDRRKRIYAWNPTTSSLGFPEEEDAMGFAKDIEAVAVQTGKPGFSMNVVRLLLFRTCSQ